MGSMNAWDMPSLFLKDAGQIEGRKLSPNDLAVCATVVRTANSTAMNVGDRFWVTHSGELIGFTGGGCVRSAVKKAAKKVKRVRKARLIRSVPKEKIEAVKEDGALDVYESSCPSKGEVDIFLEPLSSRPKTIIFGDTDLAKASALFVKEAGHDVEELLKLSDGTFDQNDCPDFIIIATQGVGDRDALKSALSTKCRHIFFVASLKKSHHLAAVMKAEGVEGWDRVVSPAGLNIGARGPVEIAISIVAQIILLRSSNGETNYD